jgi:plasmid maintenance system antidote protein VapI
VSPTTWLNLQNKYDIYLMETNKKEKAELSKVYERVFAFTSAMAVA